ncbi:MAG: hypothetical protein H7Z40_18415 [Phycisphaerae bacterium]|nr:hypothetical protein [Gemmatimonadaceae bacterium]
MGQHTAMFSAALAKPSAAARAAAVALALASIFFAPLSGGFAMLPAQGAPAQPGTLAEHIAAGDKATDARQPKLALAQYEAALQAAPRSTDALWKASGAAIDIGEVDTDEKRREATFAKATDYARRAIATDSSNAEANFAMARGLGRSALTVGPRDRIKFAKEVRRYALKTLSVDAKHPGAMHVMGVWNAEIMRLNGMVRLFAKTVLGGQILGEASWAAAAKYLEQSVAIDPIRAVHRLDLARVYRDMGRKPEARAAYEAAIKAPLKDANDDLYQRQAAEELRALK